MRLPLVTELEMRWRIDLKIFIYFASFEENINPFFWIKVSEALTTELNLGSVLVWLSIISPLLYKTDDFLSEIREMKTIIHDNYSCHPRILNY